MVPADPQGSLLARLLAQRESWCVLREASEAKPALRVLLRRPPEGEFHRFNQPAAGVSRSQQMHALVADYSVGWDGFTEAELFGAAVGSSDPLPFDGAAWSALLIDDLDWLGRCADHLTRLVTEYIEQKKAAAKN